MRIASSLLTLTILALLGSFSFNAHAVDDAIKITSIAQVEVESIDKKGNKTLKLTSPDKAVPGTEVIFTNTFENVSRKAASNISINNPIPPETEYKAGSAFGKDCDILFSADGGKTFGHAEELKVRDENGKERTALARDYTHIRWNYKKPLGAGKSGEVGFRATIK
jgi:uncharacterized repeat protein (TIGR01451 family)